MIIVHFAYIIERSRLCRGYRFLNAAKIMLFISDVQNYIPIKLCRTSGSIHLFKIKGILKSEDIKLNRNYLWNTLEINWNKITITFNDNKIDLPKIVRIKIRDKIRVRRLMNREQLNLHVMIRQGITWYNLETETGRVQLKFIYFIFQNMACLLQPECNFLHGFFRCKLQVEVVDVEVKIMSMQGTHIFR